MFILERKDLNGNEWYELSKHRTLSAAVKRWEKERLHLTPMTWDCYMRIRKGDKFIDPMLARACVECGDTEAKELGVWLEVDND